MRSRWRTCATLAAGLALTPAMLPAVATARATGRPMGHPTPSIVNGSTAVGTNLGMVARVIFSEGTDVYLCSGTVVSANVILTAGHCAEDTTGLVNSAASYQVTTGTQSLATPGQVSGVSQVIPYPTFDPTTLAGDAAVLILSTPTTVTPVALAADPADASLYTGGTGSVITGWGVFDSNGDLPSSLLYGADVVQSAGDCAQQAAAANAVFDAENQLCAVDAPYNTDGTCHGDSGGPILATVNQTSVEIGITSFGPSNCDTAQPGFFTRVDTINSWIQSEIQSHPPAPPTPTPPAAAPTPAPPASPPSPPTAPVAAPQPEAGVYHGRTSQDQTIRVQVDQSRAAISNARFGVTLRCSRHRRLAFAITPGLQWKLSLEQGLGFTARFHNRGGAQYRLAGTFSSSGAAAGSLSVTWRTARDGSCTSGPVRWSASR